MDRYDSRPDTWEHIDTVRRLLGQVVDDLQQRAQVHDRSKLVQPELAMFDEFTPKLRGTTYGSPEYKEALAGMREGLAHHYAANDHHPEHFEGGVHEMDLVQVMEMLADWKAATLRHADGNLLKSISLNAERFGYDGQFERLLVNTASRLGWL